MARQKITDLGYAYNPNDKLAAEVYGYVPPSASVNSTQASNTTSTTTAQKSSNNYPMQKLGASTGERKEGGLSVTTPGIAAQVNGGFSLRTPMPIAGAKKDGTLDTSKMSASVSGKTTGGVGGGGGVYGSANFTPSDAYNNAMAYTNQLLAQLSSGRTSYTDQINALMDQINNRASFNYDPDTDPLFQSYLNSSMDKGKTAMADTMAQASALTGGYGSTYATAAANGAYNNFIQDAYDNLPEYYQAALDTYNGETQNLYNRLGMYNTADQIEYDRLSNSYQNNFAMANDIYGKDYTNYWDKLNYDTDMAKYNQDLAYKYASLAQDQAQFNARMAYQAKADSQSASSGSSKSGANVTDADWKNVYSEIDRALANHSLDSDEVIDIIQYYESMGYDPTRLENYARSGVSSNQDYASAQRQISNAFTQGGERSATDLISAMVAKGYDERTLLNYYQSLKNNSFRK